MTQVSDIIVVWNPEDSGQVQSIQIQSRVAGTTQWAEQAAAFDPAVGTFRFQSNAPASDVEVRTRYRATSGVFGAWKSATIRSAGVAVAYDKLTGLPTSLSDISPGEGGKLEGIAEGATVGAPAGTLVGDVPAEAVVGALKNNAGQIIPVRDILVDLGELQETFGYTVSASAAADAARISEGNAKAATDAAVAARDDAVAKARAAAVSATDAGGFATTASGQATIATQKADAAGQNATIADGKAQIATTKAGEASVSASSAATSSYSATESATAATTQAGVSSRAASDSVASANSAAGSASTAATKSDSAGQSASAANQSRIDAQAANGSALGAASSASGSAVTAGAHASAAALSSRLTAAFSATRGLTPNGTFESGPEGWAASPNMVWAPNYYRGPGFKVVNDYGSVTSAKTIRVDTARKYRLSTMLVNHGPNAATVYAGVACYDNNTNFLGNVYLPQLVWGPNPTMPPGSVQPASNDITGEAWTAPSYGHGSSFITGTVYVQLLAFLNYPSPQAVSTNMEINYLYLEDVTSEKAAETQAGIATASAATATEQSSSAQNSANLSATYRDQTVGYRNEAAGYRDSAIAQAGVASSQAAVATTQAALASTSATVSASVGSGLANKGSTFSVWPDGQAIPSYWTPWGDASNAKLPGIVGRYGFQQYAGPNAPETGLQATLATDDGFTSLKAGTYIVDAEVTLDGGSFPGAGVLFRGFNAGGNITNDCYNSFAAMGSDVSPDAATGNGVAGTRYRFTQMFTLPGNTESCMVYLMTQWAGFGARNEKRMTWHKVGVRRATQAETQSGKVADINARVTNQSGAIAVLNGKNMAWMQTEAIAGDGRAIVSIRADGQAGSSNIDLAASQIRLINSAGGVLSPTLSVQNGNVTIAGDLYMGAGRIVSTNGAFMKVQGTGFGTANQFLEWFGPNMPISSCSEANAKSYSKTNGDTYFGGSLSAGKLTNAVQTTMQAYDASVTTGGFGSNGGARVVTVSYSASSSSQVTNQCPTPYTPYATVRLYRGTNASGTLLSEQTFNGTHSCDPGAGQFEPGYMADSISGTITYTDNTGGLSSSYFAQIVGRNIMTTNLSQGLGIISVEQ